MYQGTTSTREVVSMAGIREDLDWFSTRSTHPWNGVYSPCEHNCRKRTMSISGTELGSSISEIALTLMRYHQNRRAGRSGRKERTSREVEGLVAN